LSSCFILSYAHLLIGSYISNKLVPLDPNSYKTNNIPCSTDIGNSNTYTIPDSILVKM